MSMLLSLSYGPHPMSQCRPLVRSVRSSFRFVLVSCWNKAELDDVLCALHADEVKQVAVGMLGKAAIKVGPTAALLTIVIIHLKKRRGGMPLFS